MKDKNNKLKSYIKYIYYKCNKDIDSFVAFHDTVNGVRWWWDKHIYMNYKNKTSS